MRTLLVGEAPARNGGPVAFDGGRLERLLDVPPPAVFDTVNLLDYWPGLNGKGSAFPEDETREAADRLDVEGRTVILAGRRVARAFEFPYGPWMRWQPHRYAMMAVLPHPSGINRWWNDPTNQAAARRFLRAAY